MTRPAAGAKMPDIEKIRAREGDPAMVEYAQDMSDKINARIRPARLSVLSNLAQENPRPAAKIFHLRRITDHMAEASKGLVPCASGCSSCCSMDTLMSVEEAQVMASELGIDMVMPEQFYDGVITPSYEGVPCPFLKNRRCSIYASRPYACRIHVSIDRDNLLCHIVPGETIKVPRLDTIYFDIAYSFAFGGPAMVRLADIRSFFPGKP